MPDQLGINSTQQKLLNSGSQMRRPQQGLGRRINRKNENLLVNASEKRYLWTARAFAVVTAISLCCNFILLLTVANILPLYRVEPYLLTLSNKEEQVYRIVPYTRNMESQKAITETFVREYVLLRATLLADPEEMESRWQNGGDLQEMSAPSVYSEFMKETYAKLMKRIKQDGLTSKVKIITVNEVEDGRWQVEYKADYYLPTSYTPKTIRYRASLVIKYVHKRVQYKERLKNPVGFTVIKYGIDQLKE